jgi:hypothetical protein
MRQASRRSRSGLFSRVGRSEASAPSVMVGPGQRQWPVSIGEAGIIAAQSIGEPGTSSP